MVTELSQVDDDDVDREEDDFLSFWAQHRAQNKPTIKTILGLQIEVPTELPLSFEDRFNELKDTSADAQEELAELLELLFGQDVFATWKAKGLTTAMLKVLLVWGAANGGGQPMEFNEAAVKAAEWEAAADEGKAKPVPNRRDRRGSSKTAASAKGGPSSSRTSAASTASRRKTSRA